MAERERDPHLLDVPNTPCQPGLQCVWGLGNQLFVYQGKKADLMIKGGQHMTGQGKTTDLHEVKWDTDMYGPITRKLVNESHNIFLGLQSQARELSGSAFKAMLVKKSKEYRAVLKACALDFNRKTEAVELPQMEMFERQTQMIEMTELIWSLCEILWIDVSPGGVVISQLLDWLRWHFTEGERLSVELFKEEHPDHHGAYWPCVLRLVLQGQIDKARGLLARNVNAGTEPFENMDDLLRRMPLYSQMYQANSVCEFEMKWQHWHDECERRLEEGIFSNHRWLEDIARVLCGDEAVFATLKELCDTWYHMLVSKMLYQKPTVKSVDLHYYVKDCLDEYRNDGRRGELDRIIESALEFDIHQVIKDCGELLSSWWFVAHFTDLLYHTGQLESHRLEFGSNLREFLLLDYATTLMSHNSLWQIGVEYLDQCQEFGRKYLECYIENLPIKTEKKALKVIAVCEKRGMKDQAKSICKMMGMRCIQNQRLGSALSWFMKSKDAEFATRVAEKFLSEYNEQGQFSNLDLIDNLGSSMLLSNRLTFLGKYREYHKLYEEKEFHAAGSLLLSLLTSRLAPREFWGTLLKDAIALLEARELIFGSHQTFELMHCLEELTKDSTYLVSKKQENDDFINMKETVDLLNLALTRNLARSIVVEGTVITST